MPFLPYIPFANCAEVVQQFTLGDQVVMLTNGVRKSSAFSGSDLSDILAVFRDFWDTKLHFLVTEELIAGVAKITDLTTVDAPIVEELVGPPTNGAVTTVPVPNNGAMVVSFKTALRGRSFRGRNYVPSLPAAALATTSTWTTDTLTAMTEAYEYLGAQLALAGFQHVILSRQNDGERRTTGVATAVVTYIARAAIGTQRRRVIGRGV